MVPSNDNGNSIIVLFFFFLNKRILISYIIHDVFIISLFVTYNEAQY